MIRVTIPVPDIATQIASYNKIEIGRASTKADADSRTGTWSSLGQVVTLVPTVSKYQYDDEGAAEGYFHTYRLINSSTSAAGSYSTVRGKTLDTSRRRSSATTSSETSRTALGPTYPMRRWTHSSEQLLGLLTHTSAIPSNTDKQPSATFGTRKVAAYIREKSRLSPLLPLGSTLATSKMRHLPSMIFTSIQTVAMLRLQA